jgi:hypothetical protein
LRNQHGGNQYGKPKGSVGAFNGGEIAGKQSKGFGAAVKGKNK